MRPESLWLASRSFRATLNRRRKRTTRSFSIPRSERWIARNMIVLRPNLLYTPQEELENPLVFVEDGIVTGVFSETAREIPRNANVIDLSREYPDAILAPGFIDIHMHGGAGLDVMRASAGELPRLNHFLTKHGVTGYFPTTVAAPLDQTCAALEQLADAIEAAPPPPTRKCEGAAAPHGLHLEGPFLSHKRRGVHPPENLVEPTVQIFERLWRDGRGQGGMMASEPEQPGGAEGV